MCLHYRQTLIYIKNVLNLHLIPYLIGGVTKYKHELTELNPQPVDHYAICVYSY
jgi:hypothetical protein